MSPLKFAKVSIPETRFFFNFTEGKISRGNTNLVLEGAWSEPWGDFNFLKQILNGTEPELYFLCTLFYRQRTPSVRILSQSADTLSLKWSPTRLKWSTQPVDSLAIWGLYPRIALTSNLASFPSIAMYLTSLRSAGVLSFCRKINGKSFIKMRSIFIAFPFRAKAL